MSKKTLYLLISLLTITISSFAKEAYKIVLKAPNSQKIESSYILSIYEWGERRNLDTSTVSNSGQVIFSGSTPLNFGQYSIIENKRESTKPLMEFLISPTSIKKGAKSVFNITPSKEVKDKFIITQEKGSSENQIYIEFQNLINTGWKNFSNPDELNNAIKSLIAKSEKECPNSILEIMLKHTLFPPKSMEELLATFPWEDTLIVNTAFGRDKVKQYLKGIEMNPNDTLTKLVDNLITRAGLSDKAKLSGSKLQGLVATTAFDYFQDPEIMGQEGVAVGIAQNWFLNKKIECPNEETYFLLNTFVGLNKSSLIGMQAPELNLVDTTGNRVSLNSLHGDYTIVYFFTDDCNTCKVESSKLIDFVNEYEGGVITVYAIYTHDNINNWKRYIHRYFNIYNPFVNWVNVYDPEFESGFHLLYNVISTPQMFLLDSDKKIIGRNLKTNSLGELLSAKNKERDDLHSFFGNYFKKLGELDIPIVQTGIDEFYNKSKENTALFKELFRELYNYLRLSDNYLLQEGAAYLGEKYIIGKEDVWDNKPFIDQVKKAIEVYMKNRIGADAANLVLEDINGSSIEIYNVKSDYKVLYFYKTDCGLCSEVSKEMKRLYENYKNEKKLNIEFLAINTGRDYNKWAKYVAENGFSWINVWGADETDEIYNKYFIEEVPAIYLLKGNMVIAKNINDIDLEELLTLIYDHESKQSK